MQGHAGHRDPPGVAEEVEQVPAGGVGVLVEELGDGADKTRQELAVGAPGEAVVGGLNHLLGGQALLGRGSGTAEAKQAGDLSDLETGLAVEQEVTEQADGAIVPAATAEEGEGGLQNGPLRDSQGTLVDVGVC